MVERANGNGNEYGRFYSWTRITTFTLAMVLVEFVYTSLTSGISLGTLERDAEVGIAMAVFLVWLVYNLKLRPLHVFLLIWLTIYFVRYFNNIIEGYFFTDVFSSLPALLSSLGITLLSSLLIAGATGFILLHPETNDSLWERSRRMISRRSRNSWILRIVAAVPLFLLVYFVFGMAVSPFVYPYYTDPSLGLKIPAMSVMIPVELVRGLIYTLVLIPIIVAVGTGRLYVFIATSMMLFIPGALVPLIESPLPMAILPFHMVELLADSLAFGYILTLLFTPPQEYPSGRLASHA